MYSTATRTYRRCADVSSEPFFRVRMYPCSSTDRYRVTEVALPPSRPLSRLRHPLNATARSSRFRCALPPHKIKGGVACHSRIQRSPTLHLRVHDCPSDNTYSNKSPGALSGRISTLSRRSIKWSARCARTSNGSSTSKLLLDSDCSISMYTSVP